MTRRLFDCFLFFNELDILEIRLRELESVVDFFVLVESEWTFQGRRKPLVFADNRQRFARWSDKIIHVPLTEDIPPSSARDRRKDWWRREHGQRDHMIDGLVGAKARDLVMVSDVDEIPKASVLRRVVQSFKNGEAYVLLTSLHCYALNCRLDGAEWVGPRMVERRNFTSGQRIKGLKHRASRGWAAFGLEKLGVRHRNWVRAGISVAPTAVPDAGWHFTSVGGYFDFRKKMEAYAHPEHMEEDRYLSQTAFEREMEKLSRVPLEELPECVSREDVFRHLLAPRPPNP